MTLWPISMLSRIFDSARAVVPASQAGRQDPGEQEASTGDLQAALGLDHALDVLDVALSELGDDARAQRVELGPELLELLGGQGGTIGGRHGWLL